MPHSKSALFELSPEGIQKTEQKESRKHSLPVSFKTGEPTAPNATASSGSVNHRSTQSFDDRNSILNGILVFLAAFLV